jgi:hypothetical protein
MMCLTHIAIMVNSGMEAFIHCMILKSSHKIMFNFVEITSEFRKSGNFCDISKESL